MAPPKGFSVTWLGHSTFVVQLPNGKRLLIDPFITPNPACPADKKDIKSLGPIDLLLLSHGHADHTADAVTVAKIFGCPVVGIFELLSHLEKQGITNLEKMNKGGTITLPDIGVSVTLTHAFHSSSLTSNDNILYMGEPAGLVVTLEDGFAFYFAGDTAVFSDMALIAELYEPKLAFLPIGDRLTMGPREAAKAITLLSTVDTVFPMHYATFPILTGTPEAFAAALQKVGSSVELIAPKPGETHSF